MAHDLLEPARPGLDSSPFGPPYGLVLADGEFVAEADARVSVHASTLSYGTGTFDGIRAFWNPGHRQLYLLDAVEHYDRLHRSARILGLPLPWATSELVGLTAELLRRNRVATDAYVRPILFLSGPVLPVRMHDVSTRFTVAATPVAGHYASPQGLRCQVSSWRRAPDVSTPVRAKVIGSYVGPALAKTEAVRAGYDDALLLTHDGFVAEATTSNVLIRTGADWATPPATDDILPGITRRRVMQLIEETAGRPVCERRIHRSELFCCDEVLLCGTATTVASVVEVDGHRVGDGAPGALTAGLREEIQAIARRDDPRHEEWTIPVYGEEGRP
ncbi:MAG TPA: aminotransferase class IV [Streptosporangiaceae bacterium]|jgi:branched-chain amino acid aminotransferase